MARRGPGNGMLRKRANPDGTSAWVADYTDGRGRRHRVALASDRRVAERSLASMIRDRDLELRGLKSEDGMEQPLSQLRDAYLADLPTYAKATQVERARCVLAKVITSVGDRRIRDLRVDVVQSYRQRRLAEGAAPRTVNLEIGMVKAMLNWGLRSGLVTRNPIQHLRPLPGGRANEKRPRRALTHDEVQRFLAAAEAQDHASLDHFKARPGQRTRFAMADRPRVPQAPLWRALLFTGSRWGELTMATWGDFNDAERTIRLRAETTKSRKQRTIPLVGSVVSDLVRLREIHQLVLGHEPKATDSIFLGPMGKPITTNGTRSRWRFRKILETAGIPERDALGRSVVIHSTRHTFASQLGRAGVGLTHAQQLLGHSDPRLTAMIYTHLDVEDLRHAVECLEPTKPKLLPTVAERATQTG